jgi:hypothetical protein
LSREKFAQQDNGMNDRSSHCPVGGELTIAVVKTSVGIGIPGTSPLLNIKGKSGNVCPGLPLERFDVLVVIERLAVLLVSLEKLSQSSVKH